MSLLLPGFLVRSVRLLGGKFSNFGSGDLFARYFFAVQNNNQNSKFLLEELIERFGTHDPHVKRAIAVMENK